MFPPRALTVGPSGLATPVIYQTEVGVSAIARRAGPYSADSTSPRQGRARVASRLRGPGAHVGSLLRLRGSSRILSLDGLGIARDGWTASGWAAAPRRGMLSWGVCGVGVGRGGGELHPAPDFPCRGQSAPPAGAGTGGEGQGRGRPAPGPPGPGGFVYLEPDSPPPFPSSFPLSFPPTEVPVEYPAISTREGAAGGGRGGGDETRVPAVAAQRSSCPAFVRHLPAARGPAAPAALFLGRAYLRDNRQWDFFLNDDLFGGVGGGR
jgi:hypothetical protein